MSCSTNIPEADMIIISNWIESGAKKKMPHFYNEALSNFQYAEAALQELAEKSLPHYDLQLHIYAIVQIQQLYKLVGNPIGAREAQLTLINKLEELTERIELDRLLDDWRHSIQR